MRKQETALTNAKLLKLIGKPTPDTQYNKTALPGVINLLKYYRLDANKVYPYYDVFVSTGWVTDPEPAFRSNVRKTKVLVAQMLKDEGEDTLSMDEKLQFASEGQLAILKKQIAAQNRELADRQVEECIAQRVLDNFSDAIENVKPAKVNLTVNRVQKRVSGKKYYNILPISDVHYGEVVDSAGINGLNSYNTAISKKRHIKLFEKNYEFSSIYGCNELNLFFLGDIFSGNIHAELRETNEKQITECVLDYYSFIIGLIDSYAKLYDKIDITCVVGNHARNTDKYQFKNKGKDSYEYILYGFMQKYYELPNAPKNVTVHLGESTVAFAKVGDQVWKLEHGDRYKGGSAFVSPFSTVVRDNFKDRGMFRTDDQEFDAVLMGHWHIGGEMSLQGSNTPVYLNPSLIGPGEYSVHNLHSSYPAESFIFITDGKKVVSKGSVNLMDIQHG